MAGTLVGAVIAAVVPLAAQTFSFDLGKGGSTTGRIVQLLRAQPGAIELGDGHLVHQDRGVVLSFLRSALRVQQTPPNGVLISLALFLTAFVMTPTLEKSHREGLVPLIENQISDVTALERSISRFAAS
jgi:flagellar biosynthetic protein FliP